MNIKRITLCPNVTFDFIHIQKQDDNNADIFVNNYKPKLSANSMALICFDDDVVNTGNVYSCFNMSDTAQGYSFVVYRTLDNAHELDYVTTVTNGNLSIIDHNVMNNHIYQYYIYKEDNNYMSSANITNAVYTNWNTWSVTEFIKEDEYSNNKEYKVITNLYPLNCWILDANLESGEINHISNKTVYDSLGIYPKVSIGNNKYDKGSVSAIIDNEKMGSTAQYVLQNWKTFCSNGRLKLLKDRAGHIWIVAIEDGSTKIADESAQQYNTVSFNWVEVMPTEEVSITE